MWAWCRGGEAEQGQRRPLSVHKFSFYTLPVQTHAYKFRSACNDNCSYTYSTHTNTHVHTKAHTQKQCTQDYSQLYVNYQSVLRNCNFQFHFASRFCAPFSLSFSLCLFLFPSRSHMLASLLLTFIIK